MRGGAACAAALVACLFGAAPAAAQVKAPGSAAAPKLTSGLPGTALSSGGLVAPPRDDVPPAGHVRTARQVGAKADAHPVVRAARRKYPGARREVFMKGPSQWQVSYFAIVPAGKPRKEAAQVLIDDRSGAVLEAWKDFYVPWTMARGYPGAFGRIANAPYIWIPLAMLFVVPFLRWPPRMLHLDLLVLSAFSFSLAFFNDARVETSVPIVYPPLVYLLGRMLWIGLRSRGLEEQARRPLPLLVPVTWLAVAVVFLLGFRVALNVLNSNVIDVGYAGVIGADRIVDGKRLYGNFPQDNASGDTYGPVVYEAYVPFEQGLKWSGRWDDLPAAHAAAIAFDLLCCLLCFLVGRRVRGPDLGIVLAYAWVTFPFTLYALMSNVNDSLAALLVLAAVWAAGGAPARGAFIALAGLTKFAQLALAPLFACHPKPRPRAMISFTVGFAIAAALAFLPILAHDDVAKIWERTIKIQAERGSPFSIWGLYDPDVSWLDKVQHVVQGATVVLALALAFVPRRRDLVGLAACAAAILIAVQLGLTHWFYLYIPWFFPLLMIALLGRFAMPPRARAAA